MTPPDPELCKGAAGSARISPEPTRRPLLALYSNSQLAASGWAIRWWMRLGGNLHSTAWAIGASHPVLHNTASGSMPCQFIFTLKNNGKGVPNANILVQSGSSYQDDADIPLVGAVPVDQWTELTLSLREAGTSAALSATIGGREAVSATTLTQCALGGTIGIYMGFHCDTGTAELREDDIVVDFD